jgi:hypothetical protein
MKKILIIIFGLFVVVNLYSQANTYGDPIYVFSPGKYNMLDFPVNIRSQPNTTGSIVGKLELHSEIEIIEKTDISQTIEGMTHYWYKIKYGNITGYIWGGYISIKTDIYVFGNNKVYCYYRVSKKVKKKTSEIYYHYFDDISPSDIFIYVNNKRILVNEINNIFIKYKAGEVTYYSCNKTEENEIKLFFECTSGVSEIHILIKINGSGEGVISEFWAGGM